MKTWFRYPLILGLIAAGSGLLIGVVDHFVDPLIRQHEEERLQDGLREIFEDAEFIEDEEAKADLKDWKYIKEIYKAYPEGKAGHGQVCGYVYESHGRNAYGSIGLLTGIDPSGEIVKVQLIDNGQSFKEEVDTWIEKDPFAEFDPDDPDNVDTHCGATYGADLVKKMVTEAMQHFVYNYMEAADATG